MANSRTHRRRIGEILIEEGIIGQEQLDEALALQRQTGELLGTLLMDMGLVTESDIAKIVSVQYQLPFLSLKNYDSDPKFVEKFDPVFLHRHRLLPIDQVGNTLLVIVTEIPTEAVLAEIPARSGLNAALFVGFSSEVGRRLDEIAPLPEEEKSKLAARVSAATSSAAQPGDEDSDDAILFDGGNQNLMDELDSTWDSIFDQLDTSTDGDGDGDDDD